MYLAQTPFGRTGGISAYNLKMNLDLHLILMFILLDGEIPFNENDAPITLEGDEDIRPH